MKTKTDPTDFPLHAQIQLLLDCDAADCSQSRFSELAKATGLSDQTWANLLQGKSTNPRLNTLLILCQFFGISLDYFNCTSETECREYLYIHRLRLTSPLLDPIETAADRLSPQGQRNVLAIMEWMRMAARAESTPT